MGLQASEVRRGGSTTVTVSALPGLEGASLVASSLAAFLREYAQVDVLLIRAEPAASISESESGSLVLSDAERLPADHVRGAIQTSMGGGATLNVAVDDQDTKRVAKAFDTLVAKLQSSFPFIVVDVDTRADVASQWIRYVADVSVEIVEHADAVEDAGSRQARRTYRVVNLFNPASSPVPISHCEPFVLPRDSELPSQPGEAQVEHLRTNRRTLASPPMRRLARKILKMSVGLAIGGGAAFGVGHVGLLKVFEDNDIPVDLVAGTSMGSIIAVGYAAGISPSQMLDISARLGTKPTTLSVLDFTRARSGLLAGNRVIAIFSPFLGPIERFEELRFPCRVVATDIETGERVIIGDGSVIEACRASCSVPVVWVPARRGERILVDGALVDPVPAEVVREMGADVCIAVNAVPGPKKGVTNALTRQLRRLDTLNPLSHLREGPSTPNAMDIFMNTMRILQHELGKFRAVSADLTITPDLSDFTWVEFYKTKDLIERGAEAAEEALPEVRRLLDERRVQAVAAARDAENGAS
jgi:NTE family protein